MTPMLGRFCVRPETSPYIGWALAAGALSATWLLLAAPAWADAFKLEGPGYRGRVDFVFVGASLADNTGLTNGVNCLKPSATTTVHPGDLPQHARLISATLYLGGSLIDDGEDYPGVTIFHPPAGVNAVGEGVPIVEDAAVQAAPRRVSFRPPGAAAAVEVTSDPTRGPYVSVYYRPTAPQPGNVGFFVTPIDVTSVILDEGRGVLAGDYQVSGLVADVCYGPDVVCSNVPGTPSCASNPGSQVHTNGAASFALLLVFEDLSLPQRSIAVYEGLVNLSSQTVTEHLSLPSPVSKPASGSLAFYGLEGDLLLPQDPPADYPNPLKPCLGADEYIEVDGDADPESNGYCLNDADNPVQNIFNSTINTQPKAPGQIDCPPTAAHDYQCCKGPSLCNVVGVDIDRFNISPVLIPGATTVRTTLKSGQDQFYLGALVLGIDVFEPTLQADTQIRVLDSDAQGHVRLGDPIVYSIAISNTGNVPATDVHVLMDAPPFVSGFVVDLVPPGAQDNSSASGGGSGTGRVDVEGFDVAPGQVAEIRFEVTTQCDLGLALDAGAEGSSHEIVGFSVAAPTVTPAGPGASGTPCEGLDVDGPFAPREPEGRLLTGGGCSAAGGFGTSALTLLLGLGALAVLRRRARAKRLVLAALLGLGISSGCGRRHVPAGPAPDDRITSLDGLPGEPCDTAVMVKVTDTNGSVFCIDRFEASLDDGALGRVHQGDTDGVVTDADDALLTTDGSTTARALVVLGALPASSISWYQAVAACANAGKRLCSVAEWELACRGPKGYAYPYGEANDETACNGFFAYGVEQPAATGSYGRCHSDFGAYDMSGNVEEWTATPVERVVGTGALIDRAVRGGGYGANAAALACAGPEFHAPPGSVALDRGFRCCRDGS
jgi:hypothetical protein